MSAGYHEQELAIALDPAHPAHVMPPPLPPGSRILDVGCGAGQTLVAAYPRHHCTGIDVDFEALSIGRSWNSRIQFVQGQAEWLPFAASHFDAAIARVSLAYTDLERSLSEIRRVVKPGGTLWLVLHPWTICLASARTQGIKGWVFFGYIIASSWRFHFTGRTFRLRGRCETFQTSQGIKRALIRHGFANIQVYRGRHFVVTATAA